MVAKQRSKTLFRAIVAAGIDGPSQHIFELRARVGTDGRDVIRYNVYRDPDVGEGFHATSRVVVEAHVREVQVLQARADRPAEIHLRYDGTLNVRGREAAFSGMVFIDGLCHVRATTPDVSGGGAIGRLSDGKAEICWV